MDRKMRDLELISQGTMKGFRNIWLREEETGLGKEDRKFFIGGEGASSCQVSDGREMASFVRSQEHESQEF